MFPVPSWYTARAFVPVDKGGQPADFQLGFMNYPIMKDAKGSKQKYLDPGGAQTVAQKSKYRDQALAVLNGYTDIDWATQWVGVTSNPTAVKIDASKIQSDRPDYWKDYYHAQDGITMAVNSGTRYRCQAAQYDVWINVVSTGHRRGACERQGCHPATRRRVEEGRDLTRGVRQRNSDGPGVIAPGRSGRQRATIVRPGERFFLHGSYGRALRRSLSIQLCMTFYNSFNLLRADQGMSYEIPSNSRTTWGCSGRRLSQGRRP